MGVVTVKDKLKKEDVNKAREEYDNFIKITIDIKQETVAIGGEYHFDAEQVLVRQFQSENSNVWGGGYYLDTKIYTTNAHLNYKPNLGNPSGDILSEEARKKFLGIAKKTFEDIESLL